MIRRPPRSTPLYSSAASDVYKRQLVLNHCPAKNSNLYGEALFSEVEELRKKYEDGWFERDGEEYLGRHDITADGKKCVAYVYKPKETVSLYGVNKYFH
eukprot:TRINITY_DN6680_c0_g1_i2.p1 TRINITY_DN6680_c0_g1~~TRINITY_DN6680_c0_g1_i2.p1  ORF type:complete len:106 (-),score=49.25 TRINITY_DN6680_c0_g1_i2:90-386(-)